MISVVESMEQEREIGGEGKRKRRWGGVCEWCEYVAVLNNQLRKGLIGKKIRD